ncbi:MAG: HAD-IA family hydrolase [Ignavibacteriaceae bacterium]|nr:HAD-IA family hydrolase [Ignavibacteriaceae bacterium]
MKNLNNRNVLAVIWDYDGTIADTREKNYNVSKKIVTKILKKDPTKIPALSSLNNYHQAHVKSTNWREFYASSFNLKDDQINEAGKLWTEYQLKDRTKIQIFAGVAETIFELNKLPQGIVSQNSKTIIKNNLDENNLLSYFDEIIGYEQVDLKRQKPYPDGLLMCVEKLTDSKTGWVLYIGDHETDVQCAVNANNILSKNKMEIKIISIGAFYGFSVDTSGWSVLPDYEIKSADKIIEIVDNFKNY